MGFASKARHATDIVRASGSSATEWMDMVKTYEDYAEVECGRVWYRVAGTGSVTPMLCVHGGPGVPHDVLLPLI